MLEVLVILMAYVMGSIPFGLVVARGCCNIDPRESGSGNTGATNVARLCGTRWGVLVLVLDALKGLAPVLLACWWTGSATVASLAGLAAVVGHIYSPFLRFSGGKAVATTIGVFLGLSPVPLLIAAALTVAVIAWSGFVSLGSLTLVTALPVLLLLWGKFSLLPVSLVIMGLVYWKHRDNIARLAEGTEHPWRKPGGEPDANDGAEDSVDSEDGDGGKG